MLTYSAFLFPMAILMVLTFSFRNVDATIQCVETAITSCPSPYAETLGAFNTFVLDGLKAICTGNIICSVSLNNKKANETV